MIAIIAIVIVVGIGIAVFPKPSASSETTGSFYKTPLGTISLTRDLPESPASVTLYKVTPQKEDMIRTLSNKTARTKPSVISEKDAPSAALSILANYGGLPSDAVLQGSKTSYVEEFNPSTQKYEPKYPVYTEVSYRRQIDGMPVVGGGYLLIDLGENGELLELRKIWRTVIPAGKVRITPASTAFEKLKQGNDLDHTKGHFDLTINRIRLGYYEKGYNTPQEYIEPFWIFQGSMQDSSNMSLFVYARQFANFTQTSSMTTKSIAGKSVPEKDPFTATFTDTSEANPTKWLWDFGDGTTSTEQNPVHTFKAAGTYNVTLTAWNDLGSDTATQQYVVEGAPVEKGEESESAAAIDTLSDRNETIATIMSTPTVTVLFTGNATAIPTTTITINATTIPTGTATASPAVSMNVTPNTTTGNATAK